MKPMTADEMLAVARATITPAIVEGIMHDSVRVAMGEREGDSASAAARNFLALVMFPKDTNKSEDNRFKRVVFCTFDQFNQMKEKDAKIAELEAKLAKYEGQVETPVVEQSADDGATRSN